MNDYALTAPFHEPGSTFCLGQLADCDEELKRLEKFKGSACISSRRCRIIRGAAILEEIR